MSDIWLPRKKKSQGMRSKKKKIFFKCKLKLKRRMSQRKPRTGYNENMI